MNKISFPKGYVPYPQLVVCSNVLIAGVQPLMVNNELPIIIGKGLNGAPLVWMRAPTGKKAKKVRKAKRQKLFLDVVKASESVHPAVHVLSMGSSVTISAGGVNLLQVVEEGPSKAVVNFMDLRNIGFDIHGDNRSLSAAGSTLQGNTMSGGVALLSFGS